MKGIILHSILNTNYLTKALNMYFCTYTTPFIVEKMATKVLKKRLKLFFRII